MNFFLMSLVILLPVMTAGQWESSDVDELVAEQNEVVAEDEELVPDDEETFRILNDYKSNPLSVNADIEQLNEFPLLNPLLVGNLVSYRKYLGDLISLYELQAVPGFTPQVIKRILPFICLNEKAINSTRMRERFARGNGMVQIKPVLSIQENNSINKWTGDRLSLLIRYKYRYKQLLQYGFTMEKDAGERLLTGKFPALTDFNSFHFVCRDLGVVETVALGDYVINLGQGLIQWHSQAFRKSASVLNVKHQGDILKPYQSSGEFYFFRGAGATFRNKKIEGTLFISSRKVTANISDDQNGRAISTSFNTTGHHRTESEIADKNSLHISTIGGNAKKIFSSGHIGVNMITHYFSPPIVKRNEPYNIYSLKGTNWINISSDFAFTIRNCHVFGEIAADKEGNQAVVAGVLANLHRSFDVSCVYRNIAATYQALFGNAFTENTLPTNEHGFYLGSSLNLTHSITFNAYTDLFAFRWIKFRVDAPSDGSQYLLQVTWKPNRQFEVYCRWRHKLKSLNDPLSRFIDFPDLHTLSDWRTHINFKVNRYLTLRSRVEFCKFQKPRSAYADPGYGYYIDALHRSADNSRSANCRIMYFETDSYDSRIYAYENDLYLAGSTAGFSGSGMRAYFNLRQSFRIKGLSSSRLTMSVKLGATFYSDRSSNFNSSGTVTKANRTDLKFQLYYQPSS